MLPVFEAAERAVRNACRFLYIEGDDARKLVRGEINFDTMLEIRRAATPWLMDNPHEMHGRTEPLKFNGISFYLVQNLPVPWRVIGLGQTTGGKVGAAIVEGRGAEKPDPTKHASTSPGPLNCNLRLQMQGSAAERQPDKCARCGAAGPEGCIFFNVDGSAKDAPVG